MNPSSCAILVPVYGAVEPETQAGLDELARRGYAVRILRGSSQVDLARSTLATQAIEDGFAETFWIDADTVFDPNDVERIREHGLLLCAGLYVRKGPKEFAGKFVSPEATFGIGGGLLEMVYVGMGFTHVRREVYDSIATSLPACGGGYGGKQVVPYFLPVLTEEEQGPTYLSEDYSFCYRAKLAGTKIMADTRIRLGHIGRYTYTWDEFAPRQQIDQLRLGPQYAEPAGNSDNGEDMSEIDRINQRIVAVETEKAQASHNWQRCDGALHVLRHMLDEAKNEQGPATASERSSSDVLANGLPVVD